MFYKDEKEKQFAYKVHTACDNNTFILDFHVTSGNIHDSVAFLDLYPKIHTKFNEKLQVLAADAGYITPIICKTLFDDAILPALPYRRPMTKQGFFKKYQFVYDEQFDCYICPNYQILNYSTTDREGYRNYKSDSAKCKKCPFLNECTNSKNTQKVVTRHIWQEYLEEADHLRHNTYIKKVYSRRKETIERVFADAKERHAMRYTRLKSLAKVTAEVTLVFACMNLKKMATKLWKEDLFISVSSLLEAYFCILLHYIEKGTFLYFRNVPFVYNLKPLQESRGLFEFCLNLVVFVN